MIYWPAKRPGAVLDYKIDWSAALQQGEQITGATVTASGVTVDAQSFDANSVTVKLSAGVLGAPAILVCGITTNSVPARIEEETIILPIGEEPVSLDMAKRQVRAEGTTRDDELLLELVQSAREHVEAYCGIRLMPIAAAMTFPSFADLDRLSLAPIQSVTAVTYLDSAGAEQTLDPATYEMVNVDADPLRPRLRLAYGKSWPAVRPVEDAVRVSAIAGYAVAPQPVLRAMLLLLTQWYDNRQPIAVGQAASELPNSVTALLTNFRR